MIIAVVILSVIALVGIIMCFSYRRRIKSINRQLEYINSHATNMIVTGDYGNASITELVNEINGLLTQTAKLRKEYLNKESNLKDTLTSLSHDIRTPLTSLDGYFQLLHDSNSPAERERYIAAIRERIESLKLMLDELFTYAKLQDGSYPLDMEYHNLNKLLYDTAFSFYDDFKRRSIEPKIQITEEQVTVFCNYTALKRAMQNIIKNSLEHGENSFSIELENIENEAVITFKNSYRNTDEIDVEHVFDRFYKADTARKRVSTGLGLSIAKEIVEKMGGQIEAHIEDNMFIVKVCLQLQK